MKKRAEWIFPLARFYKVIKAKIINACYRELVQSDRYLG